MFQKPSDLIAGIAASASVLVFTAALGLGMWWVSALAGVGVYFGVRLLLEPKEPTPAREFSTTELIEQVRVVANTLPVREIRSKAATVCVRTEEVLAYLSRRTDASPESEFLVKQYVDQARSALSIYAGAGGAVVGSTKGSEVLGQFLDKVVGSLDQLIKGLQSQDDAMLASQIEVLKGTLNDLDQMSVTIGGGS